MLSYQRTFKFGTSGSVFSRPVYVARATDGPTDTKNPRQPLHYFLDERLRERNSQAVALEPVETVSSEPAATTERQP
jgi:hypothetical protein